MFRRKLIRLAYAKPHMRPHLLPLLTKEACVIAAGLWGNELCLFKNRDRNYKPQIKIKHALLDGVEVLYLEDLGTGWVEGLNEHKIGIVNAALMVGRDEAEKKIVKTVGKKSQDGPRILEALKKTSLDAAIDSLLNFKNGIKGHTFVSDGSVTKSIEMTGHHDPVVKSLTTKKKHVRTNHGFSYPDAGYTKGDDYVSSVARRNKAMALLREVNSPKDLAPTLTRQRLKEPNNPNNIVRDTDNMSTTSQAVLNLKDRSLNVYLIPGKVEYKGYENKLPKDYTPKCKLRVFEYDENSSPRKKS